MADVRSTVPVDALRDRFLELQEREGLTASVVAMRLGWKTTSRAYNGGPRRVVWDGPRVLRSLGVKPYPVGRGYPPRKRERLHPGSAVQLGDALGMDPHEWDF